MDDRLIAAAWEETEASVMGTRGRVLVLGGRAGLAADAMAWLRDLERRWTRFDEASELMRLNATPGRPVVVSAETFAVVARAVEAWSTTYGRFDPTVHDALRAAGYDRTFDEVRNRIPSDVGAPTPGCGGIVLDPIVRAVTLPDGVRLDLGGIGKGYAADLVAARAIEEGAEGVCVDLGGDVRVWGTGAEPDGVWRVLVESAFTRRPAHAVRIAGGAVATTSRLRRRWIAADGERHHVIDPATGRSAQQGVAAVTVLAGEAWRAEILTKALFVAGIADAGPLLPPGAGALFVDDRGGCTELGAWAEFAA